jgi:hypothetical protein
MTEVEQTPVEITREPSSMNIIELRRHASSLGHTGVWKMKKVDILSALNGLSLGESKSAPVDIPKPSLTRQVALNPLPAVPEHPQPQKQRGINLRLLRSDCKKHIAVCENPQVLLNVLAMLGVQSE